MLQPLKKSNYCAIKDYPWLINQSLPDTIKKVKQLYITDRKTLLEVASILSAPDFQMVTFIRKLIPKKGVRELKRHKETVLTKAYLDEDNAVRKENRFYSVLVLGSNPKVLASYNGVVA
ncbi:MAG: hypothetical protein PF440_10340 [Thiomicrorhabdus sp.]|jgi:hypothetical protein|nr:hypothetical protein [Thiomicrorhabdus sp.]